MEFFKKNKKNYYKINKELLKDNGIEEAFSEVDFINFAKSKNIVFRKELITQELIDEYLNTLPSVNGEIIHNVYEYNKKFLEDHGVKGFINRVGFISFYETKNLSFRNDVISEELVEEYLANENKEEISEIEKTELKLEDEKFKRDKNKAIKELVGGFFYSSYLYEKLKNAKLVPTENFVGEIQSNFKKIAKGEDISTSDLVPLLDQLIEERLNNLTSTEKELQLIELENINIQDQMKTTDSKEEINRLKNRKNELKNLKKVAKKREKIKKGVSCKIPKNVFAQKGHSGLTKGLATWGFGLVGLAAASGSKSELQTMYIPATVKVIDKGVIIEAEHEKSVVLPFNQIISASDDFGNIVINLVGYQKLSLENCEDYNEVRYLINEGACGEEGQELISEKTVKEDKEELSSLEELEKLANLYEKGLLSDEEFKAMKSKIINK